MKFLKIDSSSKHLGINFVANGLIVSMLPVENMQFVAGWKDSPEQKTINSANGSPNQ